MKKLLAVVGSLLAVAISDAATADQVAQYEITWQFDHAYTVGQFANGDWWVVGPVTITNITPAYRVRDFWDFTAAQTKGVVLKKINGWQVNPTFRQKQGFDETLLEFDSTVVPALPYLAVPGQSIVKVVSDTGHAPGGTINYNPPDSRMTGINVPVTAAVLTVVDAVPPDSGRTVFRPPYVGTDKPYYSTNDLQTGLLPSLVPVANTPSLDTMVNRFRRVYLSHKACPAGNMLRPLENMASPYGPYDGLRNAEGALRLMLNDPLQDKMFLLIVYVQCGIDIYHFILGGGDAWPGAGYGVEPGHKLPLAFAAVMLDNQAMKEMTGAEWLLASGNDENTDMFVSTQGNVLWGPYSDIPLFSDREHSYWYNGIINPGACGAGLSGSSGDPYGYIDSGPNSRHMNDGYQTSCLSGVFDGEGLAGFLIPEIKQVWNRPDFFQYVDRWVNHGLLTQPDPCAPAEGTWSGGPLNGQRCTSAQDSVPCDATECIIDAAKYGVTFGPDPNHPGDCIRDTDPSDGIGRFPSRDGMYPNGGNLAYYYSTFVTNMWNAYRAQVPLEPPAISPSGGTFAGAVDVTLVPDPSSWQPEIHYTTDGSDPTSSSARYSQPVRLMADATLKARAFYGSYTPSAVVQAAFTITADNQAPFISRILTTDNAAQVTVVFNELVDSVTARQAVNYTLNKGVTVLAAVSNGATVVLTTSGLQADTVYTLTVNNVQDLSGNSIAAGTQQQFTFYNFNPVTGLTGFWPFNNDQGGVAKDFSGNGYDATVTGAVWAPGKMGQGLQFTAVDRVPLEKGSGAFGMDAANAFTIALWVKITGHNSTTDEIVSRTNNYGPCPFNICITNTGHIATTVGSSSLTSTAVLADSTWYYVALTYKDSSRVLYINGIKDNGGSNIMAENLYFPNTRATSLGGGVAENGTPLNDGFIGLVDEVRIYDRALTAGAIACLYADTTEHGAVPIKDLAQSGETSKLLLVLPNPLYSLDLIRDHPGRFRVYDLKGQAVATGNVRSNGVYLLEVIGEKRLFKVVLVRD